MVELVIPEYLLNRNPPILGLDKSIASDPAILSELPPMVEQQAILKDLFSCLIGGDGVYIKSDENGNYSIKCIARDSITNFVNKLIPACNDFYLIQNYAENHLLFKNGRVVHALCAALRSFLFDYVQQIASLEVHPQITLPLIIAELQMPIEILHIISTFVKEIIQNSMKGTPVSSLVYQTLSKYRGYPHVRETLAFLFNESIQPVLRFVEKWVFAGEVDDPDDEFFIQANSKTKRLNTIPDNFWDDRFSIVYDRVPSYLSMSVINRIFAAGKAKSVLCDCGKDKGEIQKSLTLKDIQIEAPMTKICKESSASLIKFFIHEQELNKCLKAIKTVFLCQRGDWLAGFFRIANSTLRRPKDQILPQDFDPHISAIVDKDIRRFIRASIEEEQLSLALQRIHTMGAISKAAMKNRITSSRSFWEYFTFKLNIPAPLNLVITQAAQDKYSLLYRHFLIWKRLERKFCREWKLPHYLRQISAARHAMHVFITAYRNYMSTIVVHPAWENFERRAQEVDDLDQLVFAHENMLQQIMKGCFILNNRISKRTNYIITLCWHFAKELKKWNKSVSNKVTDETEKKNLARPLLQYYARFKKDVGELISELKIQSENEVDPCYTDFILSLTLTNNFINNE
ncbi:Spc97 [Tritrichomonas foetus]|uniref:Spc97 n=1 Tax=Tritrichomonas foetus TaxID=1144522 RepID=A0A1J4KBQ0_9EUKA|nr:Spc97 [Tritrichomonas foetus]|eukprot:OHT07116.1 Spc97 [Tritrichomonas foetus]